MEIAEGVFCREKMCSNKECPYNLHKVMQKYTTVSINVPKFPKEVLECTFKEPKFPKLYPLKRCKRCGRQFRKSHGEFCGRKCRQKYYYKHNKERILQYGKEHY